VTAGAVLPPDLHAPQYGAASLADVLPGVATALGAPVQRGDLPADPLGLTEALGGARRVAVLLVDGLGADLLDRHAHLAPTLAALASPAGRLQAPCPSTTPVSLVTLGTGMPPGSHGVLGFVTDVPGENRTLNHVQWGDDPDPDLWQARPTVFEQLAGAGVPTAVVGPAPYRGSGLTRSAYRGAAYPGSFSPGDLAATMVSALADEPRTVVYGYVPELDLTGHVRGVDSPAWRTQLQLIDHFVEQLIDGLPADAALLVTADHGMLDIPAETRLDLAADPELNDGVRVVAGEPRARYVHTEPGAADDVLACWRTRLGERAWVASRAEAVEAGLFGVLDESVAARVGDVVAFARGTWAVIDTEREPGPSRLAAYHGSLTATELAIPLLLARGPALG
jgi:hypothetical protein